MPRSPSCVTLWCTSGIVSTTAFDPSAGLILVTLFPVRSVTHSHPSGPQLSSHGPCSPVVSTRVVKDSDRLPVSLLFWAAVRPTRSTTSERQKPVVWRFTCTFFPRRHHKLFRFRWNPAIVLTNRPRGVQYPEAESEIPTVRGDRRALVDGGVRCEIGSVVR